MRPGTGAAGALGLILWAFLSAVSCRAGDLPPLRGGSPPVFTADMAISLDADGRPGLAVSVSVPYTELQWVRLAGGFGAAVEIMVSLEPEKAGERVFGDVWERRLAVSDFAQTLRASSLVLDSRTFLIPPGRYRARVSVRDLDAELTASATEWFQVPDYSRIPIGLSDLVIGTADSTGRFSPVPSRSFGLDVDQLAARVDLFDRREGPWPRSYALHYRILDDQGLEIQSGQRQLTLTRSAEPVLVLPESGGLFLGSYVFEVGVGEGRMRWRVERSFEVTESGPPRGRQFTRMLEVLSYIADPKEMVHLRALRPDEQAEGWAEFWRRRDPAPGSGRNEALIEFFRRVRYAENHFQGFGPGWRSDMGRIYVKYGAPDQIESSSAPGGTATVEVWSYSRPLRRFVFEDRDGFGRFVLVSPAFE